jgi:hypothetical protein
MGMPHEMVSVYHDDKNKKLTMTHYCALANQSKLVLTELDNNEMSMDLSSDSDIYVAHEMHIHSFTVEFEGPAVDQLCGRQKSAGGKSRFHSAVENTREPSVKGPINVCPFYEHRPIDPGRRPAG